MKVDNYGSVGNISYSDGTYGFRPVVCLNSEVILEKVSDNEYEIQ